MGDINDYIEAAQIRVGGHICISGHPCRVDAVSTSTAGKHGHAKCNVTAIDIFTGKKYESITPSTHNFEVAFVRKVEYSLVDITEDGYLYLMDGSGNHRDDTKLPDFPDNFAREIRAKFETPGTAWCVTVASAMGQNQVVLIFPERK
eukprot:gene33126-40070_t